MNDRSESENKDFVVKIEPLPEKSKVIVPISMKSENYSGQKLRALLHAIKEQKCDATILIADWLYRWNSNEVEAAQLGVNFKNEHSDILKDFKVFTWKEWMDSHPEYKNHETFLEKEYTEKEIFKKKVIRTAKASILNKNIDTSVKYLLEEYAVFLTFAEFEYHIYAHPITTAMSYMYELYPNVKKPHYVQAIIKSQTDVLRHEKSMPLPARIAYETVITVLTTSEVSPETKRYLVEALSDYLTTYTGIYNNALNVNKSSLAINFFNAMPEQRKKVDTSFGEKLNESQIYASR